MANISNRKSFTIISKYVDEFQHDFPAAAGLASVAGDIVYFDGAGRITATPGRIAGLQTSAIINPATGDVRVGTTQAGDTVSIYCDPHVVMVGEITTFAITDPVTTAVSTTCFDVAGSAGAQYVDASASVNDTIRIIGLATEKNSGKLSEIGANAKVKLGFNPAKHFRTSIS